MLPPVYSPMEAKMEINSTDPFVGIFEFFTGRFPEQCLYGRNKIKKKSKNFYTIRYLS